MNCNLVSPPEKEIWVPVKGFENIYAISSFGRLKSYKKHPSGKILKLTNKNGDYFSVVLQADGHKPKSTRIHRLVAEHFIENPFDMQIVNHKDGNKQNNRVDNLEWCNQKYNAYDARKRNPHIIDAMVNYNKRIRPKAILQYTVSGEFVARFENSIDAHKATGVCARNILQVASKTPYTEDGKVRKMAGGYMWKFESEVMQK